MNTRSFRSRLLSLLLLSLLSGLMVWAGCSDTPSPTTPSPGDEPALWSMGKGGGGGGNGNDGGTDTTGAPADTTGDNTAQSIKLKKGKPGDGTADW